MVALTGGTRTVGGDLEGAAIRKIDGMVAEFEGIVDTIVQERKLRGAVVRSRLPCNSLVILDQSRVYVAAERAGGLPSSHYFDRSDVRFNAEVVRQAAALDLGYQDPFVLSFSRSLLDQAKVDRRMALEAVALTWVNEEVQRVMRVTQLVSISPLFGPANFIPNPQLCFVLMPFIVPFDEIYRSVVKPCIEAEGLVCRRADEIVSNRAIMQDIWQSICEARLVVADLSGRNPNVYYELGIAHTIGKDTILLAQRDDEKFPFDVAHIRRIVYDNTAPGGQRLREALGATIREILAPAVVGAD